MSPLDARLNKLERSIPAPEKQARAISVIAAHGDEVGAQRLLQDEGYDPDNGDLAIVEFIVSPAGQEPYSAPPYVVGARLTSETRATRQRPNRQPPPAVGVTPDLLEGLGTTAPHIS